MSMMDPIADLLTRIRNAQTAKHAKVTIPRSRVKREILRILKDEGYIADYSEDAEGPQGTLEVTLKYDHAGTPAITGLERVSKQGRRIYRGKHDIPKVLAGLGITIVSTHKGVMTGSASTTAGIGGEVLCSIW